MRVFATFREADLRLREEFRTRSHSVHSDYWQGMNIRDNRAAEMRELLNWSFQIPLRTIEDLDHWRSDIRPNLPWADDHFLERVGGEPLNPGEQWKNWPWALSADKFRTQNQQFDHTYMERMWPKLAGLPPGVNGPALRGIRFEYGDLNDLVDHLVKDPLSRQAFLPIWFPEDGSCSGRKPCTLGYHFIQRFNYLHTTYYIRSCDFVRHYADDCYLTVRLALWLLERLRVKDPSWRGVSIGLFTFHCVSMHMFLPDYQRLFPDAGR